MRSTLLAGLVALTGFAAPQVAEADPVVVELYTSQGCNSCPPADKLLGEIAKRDGIIALSLHVDYWDYLGWKDQFANPAFSDRQRGYARAAGKTMIYTPQMVVAGKDHVVGAEAMKLVDMINSHSGRDAPIALDVARTGDVLTISARQEAAVPGRMLVQLVRYAPERTADIKSGENAGRQITYHNVVTSWTVLGEWDGAAPLTAKADTPGDEPAVVIVQDGASGPILAAAKID